MRRLFFPALLCAAIAVAILLPAQPPAALAEQAPAAKKSSGPIHVEADRMESLQNENAVEFTGRVVARQDSLVIHSDRMTVFYLSEEEKARLPAGDTRKMKKLYATGHVELQNEGWIATSDNMEYFEQERKVFLTGNAKAWQDNNIVTGESITLYLDQGKSIVERSQKKGERVKAFFYPGSEGENTGGKNEK
ncbi:MAG: lipopolysaccharide transport periplasmic protein LptA [Thermodesulfobacteriota bacterium]